MGKYSDMFFDPGELKAAMKQAKDDPEPETKEEETAEGDGQPDNGPVRAVHKRGNRHLTRKAASEKALEEALDWHFQPGDCYHCFSFGDVDSFRFFKHVLKQQKIKYAALSTWCMAGEDVRDLVEWYRRGMIGRVDFFLGEIFRGSYPLVYQDVQEFIEEEHGRMVIFRNHSKVMAIKGERFDVLIESSANINTNPRSENTVLTVDSDLVDAYVKMFSEIKPFNKDDYGAEPYIQDEKAKEVQADKV